MPTIPGRELTNLLVSRWPHPVAARCPRRLRQADVLKEQHRTDGVVAGEAEHLGPHRGAQPVPRRQAAGRDGPQLRVDLVGDPVQAGQDQLLLAREIVVERALPYG